MGADNFLFLNIYIRSVLSSLISTNWICFSTHADTYFLIE